MSERDQKPQEAAARPPCTCGERDMRERDYRRLSDLMFRLEGDAERWQEEAERGRAALTAMTAERDALREAIWMKSDVQRCRGCSLTRDYCEEEGHHDYCAFGRALAVHALRAGGENDAASGGEVGSGVFTHGQDVSLHRDEAVAPELNASPAQAATPPPPSRDDLLALVVSAFTAGVESLHPNRPQWAGFIESRSARVLAEWERGRTQEVKP